jgi:ABC-type uncharacterized transport system permease subunit
MEGVQILNQFEVVTETAFNWHSFWIGALIGLGVAVIAGFIFGVSVDSWSAFFAMSGTLAICLSILIGWSAGKVLDPLPTAYETYYEVAINEEVNMREFMCKYEILETRGFIYTVREKDEVN